VTVTPSKGEAMRTFALLVALLAVAGLARADDDDPEPPRGTAALRKLTGKWNSVRMILKGNERNYTSASYSFTKDKVTYTAGNGKLMRTMTFKPDKKRPDVLEMTPENAKVPTRYFFKIEKGELYLLPDRSNDPKTKPDFSGTTMPVMILKKEK
jgi:uncharacterized protein (TIGR03067 family)